MSGSYAAWKLSEKYPDKSIHLYETNSRVGGRTYSVPMPGISDFVGDFGGMRVLRVEHPKVYEAVTKLGLEIINFTNPTLCKCQLSAVRRYR